MAPDIDMISVFGTAEPPPRPEVLRAGGLDLLIEAGAARRVRFDGTEVLRQIDYPIRDADWGTHPVVETDATVDATEQGFVYRRRFRTSEGSIEGHFRFEGRAAGGGADLVAELELTALRATRVNRAGFTLLHPIAGVAGSEVEVTHPDGSVDAARFPDRIAPAQPVLGIAGLAHRVGGVDVVIAMEGEVFEMEDQRNWSDASYKTYCRPLALPRPFDLAVGEAIRQRVTVRLSAASGAAASPEAGASQAVAPRILLAHEPGLGEGASMPPQLDRLGVDGVLLRVASSAGAAELSPPISAPVTLEVVLEPGEAAFGALAGAVARAGFAPRRVVALTRPYLASHQPEGPWPAGPAPDELVAPLRAAFPTAEIGGGMLTNFTEFNRHPPTADAVDFITFGSTAVVHAGDDRSVLETLEAHGDIHRSAAALAKGKPRHLGLVAIGMRSNPYGSAVAPNPGLRRLAMAMDDPRQRGLFAAAWAVGAAAAAARGGVASLALAMAAGPLGLAAPDGEGGWRLYPLFHAVRALAALGGAEVEVRGAPSTGLVSLMRRDKAEIAGIAANLGPAPARLDLPLGTVARQLSPATMGEAGTDADWLGRPAGSAGSVTLDAFDVVIVRTGTAA